MFRLTISFVLLMAVPFVATRAADAVVFHVAPEGNDKDPGSEQKPFATPQRARDAIRDLKRKNNGRLPGPVTVLLHGGTFVLAAPLLLTADDTGSAETPITYAARGKDRPILSGGRRIAGWKEVNLDGKKLWAAEIADVKTGKWSFHQLWINGQRRPRARHPNDGFLRIAGLPDGKIQGPGSPGQDRFTFAKGDLKAWDAVEDAEVMAYHLWVGVRLPIVSVDEKDRLVKFSATSRRRLTDGNELARYRVENALELLDVPGEWYLQKKTGTLYYWPRPGEDLAKVEAVAPVLPHLVRLECKPELGQSIEHLTFRGLTFAHTEAWPARTDGADVQAAAGVAALVQGDGLKHCRFEDCTIAHGSGYGLHLARGCEDNQVVGCELTDLGAGGVKIGEMTLRDNPREQTHGNAVTDCHIHDLGHVFPQAVGLWIGQSFDNRLAHNHVHDLFYTGISVGWTWGYGKTLARGNIIELNDIHDVGKEVLSDMGGIYTLGTQPGTAIRRNIFHDISGYKYGGWGIYFDEGSTGIIAEGNLVYRTTHGGFHQHYGKENIVRGNIFAFGRDQQLQRSRVEEHRSFTFEGNMVYWTKGPLLQGQWKDDKFTLDRNLYWRTDGGDIRFGELTLEQWRAKGQDKNSLIADPLFENPGKGDFRLKKGSPAAKIGFTMPDLSTVGPRPPDQRKD